LNFTCPIGERSGTLPLAPVDQLGTPRPANALGDVVAIEVPWLHRESSADEGGSASSGMIYRG